MLIPCVICGLGIDAAEDGDSIADPQEYEPGDGMREHLVEQHSKYVARALLDPNPEDKVHFWLLANVNSGNRTGPDGSKNASCLNGGTTAEDTDSAAANPMVDEALASAFLSSLEQFLASGPTADASAEVSVAANCDPPSVDNLVESKALRKAFCQVCRLSICSTARQRHVYMIHMKRKDIFQCAKCDYTNNNSSWEMRKHCTSHHGADGEPIEEMIINNEGHYADEIQLWNRQCFPEWKQKQLQATSTSNLMERAVESPLPDDAADDEEMLSAVETFIQKLQSVQAEPENTSQHADEQIDSEMKSDTVLSSDATKAKKSYGSALTESDWLCHLCWEESRYPGRHIAQKHLGKPLYECPLCEEFAGSYESCTVMKHIRKMHPEAFDSAQDGDAPQIAPISNLERYAEEIRELQTQCFPNRPMKLARSTANSRPRERHLCRLCDTQVAQSDRQRHVYHKHLRKEKVFQCPLCEFHSNYDIHRVKWHLKWIHKEESENVEPISLEAKYREEIDALNEQCFPDWLHRRRPAAGPTESEPTKSAVNNTKAESVDVGENNSTPSPRMEETSLNGEPSTKKRKITTNGVVGDDLTCQLCFKEFKPSSNFLRHVAKEHLKIFLYQCPLCDSHGGQDAYDVRAHMLRAHGHKESSGKEPISNFETNYDEIALVYKQCFPTRKLKSLSLPNSNSVSPTPPVQTSATGSVSTRQKADEISESKLQLDDQKVACKECQMEMKSEDRQIHVYRHHLKEPRLYECPLCDFTHHACSSDVRNHVRMQHRDNPNVMPRANLLEFSEAIAEWNDRCFPGWINRRLPTSVLEDFNRCRLCDVEVRQLSRHIAEVHLVIPLHKCPLCEYGAAEARLVNRHMRNNHKKKEIKGLEPISNVLLHRTAFSDLHDQCFPGRPKRLSNISISDDGKRMKCKRCTMTISKKRRLLHLLEKHLQKPVYRCKLCPFSSNFNKQAVELHLKEKHQREDAKFVLSSLDKFVPDLKKLARVCFNDSDINELSTTKCR